MWSYIVLLCLQIWKVSGQCDSTTEVWNYVEVRPGAHMFYWFYPTYHPDGADNRPIVIWLQGGPGGSSVGYGNFDIIGPLTLDLTKRNTSWIYQANLLFVDSPVGAGYSYVDDPSLYATNTEEIVNDLYTFIQQFYRENPTYRKNDVYIFGQSYGGKMAPAVSQKFYEEIQAGNLEMNLLGFAMGNSWVHPVDSTTSWGEFLFWMSNLDEKGLAEVDSVAFACKDAADNGEWELATDLWIDAEHVVWEHTNYVDFYNVLQDSSVTLRTVERGLHKSAEEYGTRRKREIIRQRRQHVMNDLPNSYSDLDDLMNGPVKECLCDSIPADVVWGNQSFGVFESLVGDFMKPVVDIVGDLVNNTNLDVIVYQGQLDLICPTRGCTAARKWVERLAQYWHNYSRYYNQERLPLVDANGQTDTFVKSYKNFKFYDNLRAGHAVPKDDGEGAFRMLERILAKTDT